MHEARKGRNRYTHTFLDKINRNNVSDMDEDQANRDIHLFDQTVISRFK